MGYSDTYSGLSIEAVDVVISDPSAYAVAIKYDENIKEAPFVSAKGIGPTAVDLEEFAKQSNIVLLQASDLAISIYGLVPIVGMEIPEELYEGVAEALAYAYQVQGK